MILPFKMGLYHLQIEHNFSMKPVAGTVVFNDVKCTRKYIIIYSLCVLTETPYSKP